jgi:hypothetical protein
MRRKKKYSAGNSGSFASEHICMRGDIFGLVCLHVADLFSSASPPPTLVVMLFHPGQLPCFPAPCHSSSLNLDDGFQVVKIDKSGELSALLLFLLSTCDERRSDHGVTYFLFCMSIFYNTLLYTYLVRLGIIFPRADDHGLPCTSAHC